MRQYREHSPESLIKECSSVSEIVMAWNEERQCFCSGLDAAGPRESQESGDEWYCWAHFSLLSLALG